MYEKRPKNIIKKQKNATKTRESYQNLSEEDKNKKRQFAFKWYRNYSEEENGKKTQYAPERHRNLSFCDSIVIIIQTFFFKWPLEHILGAR